MVYANKWLRRLKLLMELPFAKKAPLINMLIPKQLEYGDKASARALKFRPLPTATHRMMATSSAPACIDPGERRSSLCAPVGSATAQQL